MTNNTQFKTLLNTWLNQKKPMITPSTHASFTLIAENHLIPHFGKRKIGSITETVIQNYINYPTSLGNIKTVNNEPIIMQKSEKLNTILRNQLHFTWKLR